MKSAFVNAEPVQKKQIALCATRSSVTLTVDSECSFEGHFCLYHNNHTNVTRIFVSSLRRVDISAEIDNFACKIMIISGMRIRPNYKLREIAGETIIVNQGIAEVNLTRIISLNRTARLLFEAMAEKDFTVEDAARVLVDSYGIDEELAMRDAHKWLEPLMECGVIE